MIINKFTFTLCNANSEEASTSATGGVEKVVYPPMSKEEIEEWMEHIPVFVVTEQPENDYSVSYFFLNRFRANSLRWREAQESSTLTPEIAHATIHNGPRRNLPSSNNPATKFHFHIAQMRMPKTHAEVEDVITLLPMYFSMENVTAIHETSAC